MKRISRHTLKSVKLSNEDIKKNMQKRHFEQYRVAQYGGEPFNYQQLFCYGQTTHICSQQDDSYDHSEMVLGTIDQIAPKAIILGNMSEHDLQKISLLNEKYEKEPSILNNMENLYAKDKISTFFSKIVPYSTDYFQIDQTDAFYRIDSQRKMMIFYDQLGAGFQTLENPSMKLLFGKPDNILFLEDLCLRLSLEQLQSIFYDVMDEIKNRYIQEPYLPMDDNEQILNTIRGTTMELYKQPLYGKFMVYNASLLKKSTRTFGETLLMTPQLLVNDVVNLIQNESVLPDIDQIFRTYLIKDISQNSTKSSTNRKVKKVQDYFSKLFTQTQFQKDQEIDDAIQKSSSRFDFLKQEENLFLNLKETSGTEILHKIVLLSYLVSQEFRNYLICGKNPFKITIFNDQIIKEFQNQEALMSKFIELQEPYSLKIHQFQNFLIQQNLKFEKNQFNQLSEKLENLYKKKLNQDYEYQIGQISKNKQNAIIQHMLMNKISQNIQKNISKGISQIDTIMQLKQYQGGFYTQQNIETYLRCVAQANSDLGGIVKLPQIYKPALKQVAEKHIEKIAKIKDELEKNQQYSGKISIKIGDVEKPIKIYIDASDKRSKSQNISLDQLDNQVQQLDEKGNFIMTNPEEQKIYQMILGPDNVKELPFDFQNMSIQEMQEQGMDVISEIDLDIDENGQLASNLSKEQIDKLNNLKKILKQK